MKTQKNLKVSVLGKSYSIATDEHESDVFQAAGIIDQLVKDLYADVPMGQDKLAPIVALQLAIDLTKKQNALDKYKHRADQLTRLIEETLLA